VSSPPLPPNLIEGKVAPNRSEWCERYLEHVRTAKRLSPRTVDLYADALARLEASAGQADLLKLPTAHFRRQVAQLHASGLSPRSLALLLSSWRGFYQWLGQQGLIESNPLAEVKAPKVGKPLPKALGVDDAVTLASHVNASTSPWTESRDAAIIELFYSSGLRMAELVGLDAQASGAALGWVDMQASEVHVLGKGSKRRSVPVGNEAHSALQKWLALRPALAVKNAVVSAALFVNTRGERLTPQSVRMIVKRRAQAAGLATPVHPHMLRHSFASHVLQSSSDIRAVQELLGHANISTTQVYTRLDFQHLAKAYDAAHPRAKKK
jgi:integrase/recombinase XerC